MLKNILYPNSIQNRMFWKTIYYFQKIYVYLSLEMVKPLKKTTLKKRLDGLGVAIGYMV